MLIVVDALNRHQFRAMLAEAARRRQLCQPTDPDDDALDRCNPAHILCLDDAGQVVGGLRLMQTTGPHMLSDTRSALMADQVPLRSARLWEVSQFWADAPGAAPMLLTGALDYARRAGVLDLVALLDAPTDRVLSRSGPLLYDYLGQPRDGLVAALIECSPQQIIRMCARFRLDAPEFADTDTALAHFGKSRRPAAKLDASAALAAWCDEQIATADDPHERAAAEALRLELSHLIDGAPRRRCKA